MTLARLLAVAVLSVVALAPTISLAQPVAVAGTPAGAYLKKHALVGDKAPKFAGTTDEGKPWKSTDHVGKKIVVVYFYPADTTGGCTKQACAYRDALAKLDGAKIEVIGVSGDSVENHRVFKKMHNLNFTLLADPKGKIAKAFGVPTGPGGAVQAQFEGATVELKRGATEQRWTFVIGPDGKIAYRDTKVDAANDPQNVLAAIERLPSGK